MPRQDGFQKHPENINRNGAPKKNQTLTAVIREMLNSKRMITNKKGKKELILVKKKFAENVMAMAFKGDMAAIRIIWNYLEGMPEQRIQSDLAGDVNINLISKKEDNI